MLSYFNSPVRNSTDWTMYLTFDEGRIFYVPGNDNNTIVLTHNMYQLMI